MAKEDIVVEREQLRDSSVKTIAEWEMCLPSTDQGHDDDHLDKPRDDDEDDNEVDDDEDYDDVDGEDDDDDVDA